MYEDRASVINIGGEEYTLLLSTKATKEIAARYGGLENLGDKLMKSENFEMAIDMAKDEDMKFVTEEFYIPEAQIPRWEYFKGSKREKRVRADGFEYFYTEGGMAFPDSLDSPSRTIITSEGGKSPDRCRHVIQDQTGRLRRLIPLELERLNMFPDHHTALDGVDAGKRAFLMGNALVTGIVTKIGLELKNRL